MLKYFLCLVLLYSISVACGQSVWDKINKDPFKQSQWYLGPRFGVNQTTIDVINAFSVIKPTSEIDEGIYDKQYQSTDNVGAIFGITAMYQFQQRLVLGTNLTYNRVRFRYDQEQPGQTRSINFIHRHEINYFEAPVFFRFMFREVNSRFWNKSNRKPSVPAVIPFLQTGINFSFLLDGTKEVTRVLNQNGIETVDFSLNEEIAPLLSPFVASAFIGGGARFRMGNIYLNAEVNYRQGLSNYVNPSTRYAKPSLQNAAYDVFDDMRVQSWEALISIIVPLKYLSKKEFLPVEI